MSCPSAVQISRFTNVELERHFIAERGKIMVKAFIRRAERLYGYPRNQPGWANSAQGDVQAMMDSLDQTYGGSHLSRTRRRLLRLGTRACAVMMSSKFATAASYPTDQCA